MGFSIEEDRNVLVSSLDELGPVDGLQLYYNFDNLNGSVVTDNSGNGYNGTNYSAISTTGINGDALSFDGVSYVSTASIDLGSAFTISLWFNPSSLNVNGMLFSSNAGRPYIYYTSNDIVIAWFLTDGTTTANLGAGVVISQINTWYHVAFTHTGTSAKVYFNGNLENTSIATTLSGASYFRFIARHSSGLNFVGSIDEVRVYNRVLSDAEIKQLYKLNAPNNVASIKENQ